jgi:hypothetical protein
MYVIPSVYNQWFLQSDSDFNPKVQNLAPVNPDSPSHALFLDIVGKESFASAYYDWVGAQGNGIRRMYYPFPTNTIPLSRKAQALLWQISPDDVVFDNTGMPQQFSAGVFTRNSTYSWAYLVRRPENGDPNVVELTVVVFNDRPLTMNNLSQAGETLYNATFNPALNTVTVTWGGPTDPAVAPPPVGIGGWILDTTPTLDPNLGKKADGSGAPLFGPSHARFYRVVSITQTTGNSMDLEVQSPIRGFPLPAPSPAGTFTGNIVVIEGIAEVFEKGPIQWHNP